MKNFILTAIIFTLSLSVVFLFSCSNDSQTPITHVECSDADNDGKCDVCNEILHKEPAVCDCIDENLDGKCDLCDGRISATVSFFENGKTDFKIVASSSLSGTEMKILDDLILRLSSLGVNLEKTRDTENTESEYEILFGTPTSRGEEYGFDAHTLGPQGYTVQLIGKKILIAGGSAIAMKSASEAFIAEFLKIDSNTKKLGDLFLTTDCNVLFKQTSFRISSISIMGREICGYTIATDLSIASARNAAKTAQSLIYESAGYWLPIVDVSLAEKSFIIEHTALTGGEGFYVTVSDECVRISCEFLSKFESETVAFFTRFIKAGSGDINFTDKINYTKNLRDVCYADFGASGNGIKDDYDAIRAAHEYANSEPGHKVIASEGATYYIGKGHTSSAEIKTDTDWKNAKFIIDDSEIAPFLSDGVTENPERTMWIFQIVYTKSWYSVSKALRPSSLAKGTKNIGIAPGETAIVRVTNSNHKNYIRYGVNANSGSSQREVVLIDKDGNVLDNTELLWDFEAITEISVIPVEETPLTVSGGFFITVYNQAPSEYTSYARGIRISRSNVTLKNVIHRITDEGEHGAPMSGFTSISYANNVVIDNIEFDNPKSFYSMGSGGGMAVMGSYEISAVGSTNTTWQNCTQYDFWSDETKTYAAQSGIMGTNYCKNMNYINMTVGSFDAHQGAQNIRIIGGNIEHINAIGGGELYIEGTRIHSMYQACAVILRNDYGSLWNGNATFKDVTLVTGDLDSVALFEAYWYNHDFGYKASMPQTVTLENLRIESNKDIKTLDFVRGSAKTQASLKFWDPDVLQIDSATGEYAKNKNVYSLPERWIIKDCEGYTYVMPEEFYEVVLIEYK